MREGRRRSQRDYNEGMPELTGVVETCLYVDDLERAARFYEDVFEFKRLSGDERFCALSVVDRSVLLLFLRGGTLEAQCHTGRADSSARWRGPFAYGVFDSGGG